MPVEEQAMVSATASLALATAMAEARSFREAVGLRPSSLMYRVLRPSSSASRSALYSGDQPTRRGGGAVVSSTGRKGRYRHMERSGFPSRSLGEQSRRMAA